MAEEKVKVKVPRAAGDISPKVKAGAQTYVGVMLAGLVAALTAAQDLKLSPLATLGIAGVLGLLQLLASYQKAGDGR